MLQWRLLIGVPAVAALILLCWLDANAPAPGIWLMPFFLVCVYFLCKETLHLLNAGGIYPRRTTIYFGVFGTIVLCWLSCYNSLPLIAELEKTIANAIQTEAQRRPGPQTISSQALANAPFNGNVRENVDGSEDFASAPKNWTSSDSPSPSVSPESSEELGRAAKAVAAARNALKAAEKALKSMRGVDATEKNEVEAGNARENDGWLNDSTDEVEFFDHLDDLSKDGVAAEREAKREATLFAFSNEREWKTAAFACVHILLAIAAGVLIAFVGEMLRFKLPGGHMINLSGAIFAIVYIGLLGSFMVMLRIAYGVAAVVSMIIVTKMCDVGAYTVGRLCGRHKMAPNLSPGKTIEGGIGGMLFAILGAWFSTAILFPIATGVSSKTTWVGVVIYGLTVGFAGALGDLAESLIKRDVMRKDSGTHVPGFGGFLDIFDSLLLAAPVAFSLWAFHVIR